MSPLFHPPDIDAISASDSVFTSGTFRITGGPNITVGTDASGASISGPAAGGGATLSRFEVADLGNTGSSLSSHAPASWWFNPFYLSAPLSVSNIQVLKSISLNTVISSNSSGRQSYSHSHGVTLWKRVDWGANSTQLTTVTTGSQGISFSRSHTGSSNSASMAWVTNTTGGTSSFSTTSNASAWADFGTGMKLFAIPMVTSLSAGEYFLAHRQSSTTATVNSNVTAMSFSNLHFAPQDVTFKMPSISVAGASASSAMPAGIGFGIASAVTSTTTFAASVISAASKQNWYANFVNLPHS